MLRHADRPLGALAVDTARAAIADAGLRVDQIDGFVSSSLLPSAGGQGAEDGVSIVSSAWLAQHLGAAPRYVAGFDGIGQITGSVAIAVNAIASGAADYVLLHRALHNPAGRYHANPMREVPRPAAMDRAARLFRAAGDDRAALQRIPAALRRIAGNRWPPSRWRRARTARASRGRIGTTGRSALTNTSRRQCFSIRSAATTAIFPSTASRRSCSPPPSAPTICRTPGLCRRLCQRHARPAATAAALAAGRHHRGRCAAGPPAVGQRRHHRERRRSAAGLRRLLAVRLVMAGGPRALPAGRGAPVHRRGRHRQRPRRMRSRRCPVAARSATAACTGSRRCSSAICSWRAAPATDSATTQRSAWRAIPRRISAARWSTAPPSFESCVLLIIRISFYSSLSLREPLVIRASGCGHRHRQRRLAGVSPFRARRDDIAGADGDHLVLRRRERMTRTPHSTR